MVNFAEVLKAEGIEPAKIKAIKQIEGPLLIIAGPGSGKTKTLVDRIVYMILKGIKPENIMLATFTEKAAKELITRVSSRLAEFQKSINLNEMYIGTLHSIFLRFLEENYEHTRLKRNYSIWDQFDQSYYVYKNINEFLAVEGSDEFFGEYHYNNWERANAIITYLNKISEEDLDVNKLCRSKDLRVRAIGGFAKVYFLQLQEANALDFSSIQSEALRMLRSNPKILTALQEKIQYIMVDEYQDTNTIQEKILMLLSNKTNNICVVGDDDQSLYRFRGATVRNILEFESNFPKATCKTIKLTTNYRSHPDIIDFYNRWMDGLDWTKDDISFRFNKVIRSRNDKVFVKSPSVIKVASDGTWEDYYEETYQFIIALKAKKVLKDFNQIAFLFRSVKNDHVKELAEYLEDRGINIFSPRSALFFEREEIQLLLGAIVFIFPNLFEDLKWTDSYDLPVWETYQSWKDLFANRIRADKKKHESLLKWAQKKAKLHANLTKNTTYAFAALVYQLLEFPMFSEYIQVDLNANKKDLRASYNIAMLTNLLFKFEYLNDLTIFTPKNLKKHLKGFFNIFLRFIIDGGIEEYEDYDEYAPSGCISFMTIHQSKGLEFPVVFVGSLNLVPRKQYNDLDVILQDKYYSKTAFEPIDEIKFYDFWRLFYTAFSRPQNLLVLSVHEQTGQGKSPSKYFEKIYSDVIDWKDKEFKINKLSLDTVRPVNIMHEYSFTSHILLYENCPLQYKFYKEFEFAEVRTGGVIAGSLLHETIEDIHKTVLKGESHTLTDDNIKTWLNNNYYLLSKNLKSYLHQPQIEAILKQVLRYRDRNSANWDKIKDAEVEVSLVKRNFIIKGKIDLIKGENDTVELIDFKSGDKPDVNSTEDKIRRTLNLNRRQLETYAHLLEENNGYTISKMHLYYPKEETGSPYISFPVNKKNIEKTINNFEEVVNKIENKDFDMKHVVKSEKQCGDCDMRYHCNPKQYCE